MQEIFKSKDAGAICSNIAGNTYIRQKKDLIITHAVKSVLTLFLDKRRISGFEIYCLSIFFLNSVGVIPNLRLNNLLK